MKKTNIEALRTPEERFAVLPHFPYDPASGFPDLRMSLCERGPERCGRRLPLPHGEPDWAYLYRKMIPVRVAHSFINPLTFLTTVSR